MVDANIHLSVVERGDPKLSRLFAEAVDGTIDGGIKGLYHADLNADQVATIAMETLPIFLLSLSAPVAVASAETVGHEINPPSAVITLLANGMTGLAKLFEVELGDLAASLKFALEQVAMAEMTENPEGSA